MHWIIRPLLESITFVGSGVLLAAIGEVQFSVFLRGDVKNLLGALVFDAVYLSVARLVSWLLVRRLGDRPATVVWHGVGFGVTGLMIEWWVIGNSPWGNPQASQVGMFAYWSAMVVIPFISLRRDRRLRPLQVRLWVSVLVYALLAGGVQLIPNASALRWVYHIWSVILGYTALVGLVMFGYARAVRRVD